MCVVSPPDRNGFCSFGFALWDKRNYAQRAKVVVAEVDENQIRTYGSNYIHVSEIDYFVEHTPKLIRDEDITGLVGGIEPKGLRDAAEKAFRIMDPNQRATWASWILSAEKESDMMAVSRILGLVEPPEEAKRIGEYVSTLVKDGDCIQIGIGSPAGFFPSLGVFDDKVDLGVHSEMIARGIPRLMETGVITGKRKNVNKGKMIVTGLTGASWDELQYFHQNPLVEVYDAQDVVNVVKIAANDNQVSMNNALSIDLTGQINVETILGSRIWNGPGGQPELHIGAMHSKGGRAITLLNSTAMRGTVSRIVPQLDEGATVTIPRYWADYVVTEYGIARLYGKNFRERANELIAIAHPNFRAELKKAAQKLFYP